MTTLISGKRRRCGQRLLSQRRWRTALGELTALPRPCRWWEGARCPHPTLGPSGFDTRLSPLKIQTPLTTGEAPGGAAGHRSARHRVQCERTSIPWPLGLPLDAHSYRGSIRGQPQTCNRLVLVVLCSPYSRLRFTQVSVAGAATATWQWDDAIATALLALSLKLMSNLVHYHILLL